MRDNARTAVSKQEQCYSISYEIRSQNASWARLKQLASCGPIEMQKHRWCDLPIGQNKWLNN